MGPLSAGFTRLFGVRGWIVLGAFAFVTLVWVPVARLVFPPDSVLHISDYYVLLFGKIMCYAMVALAMDMIWGYAGILSLGHGLFFALGGYAMGMYLMREIGNEGQYRSFLPDFMVFLDWKEFPWYWAGTEYFPLAIAKILLVPGLLAFVFGWLAFRSRIKGVYFSIITQALTLAFMKLFFQNDTGFGGNNGFTDFKRILGVSLFQPETRVTIFVTTSLLLIFSLLLCRYIVTSKFGRVLTAIRDAESRTMFSGYNTRDYKLFVWTLSALLCGVAGALYVPQVGIINPSEMSPANSIEIAIWNAVGGRGTLVGAVAGAGIVNGAKSWFTVQWPQYWPYVLGALFIFVTLLLPRGVLPVFSGGTPNRRTLSAALNNNLLLQCWRGKAPLEDAFWSVTVLGSILVWVLAKVLASAVGSVPMALLIVFGVPCAYAIFCWVVIRRCWDMEDVFWGNVALVCVGTWILGWAAAVLIPFVNR